jgi:hypothetical protein
MTAAVGATEASKQTSVRWYAMLVGLLTIASACWSAWSETPSLAAPIEIAAPPIILALAALFPGELTLGPLDKTDRRGSLFFALMIAMLGLALGAWREFRELVLNQAVGWSAAAALATGSVMALTAARIDKRQMDDVLMRVLTGGAGALWAAGLLLELNGHLPDRGFVQTPVEVADKQVWRGGRGSTSYHLFLRISPSAPAGAMTIAKSLYDRTSIGAHLCVIRTTGTLTMRWWKVADCWKSAAKPD